MASSLSGEACTKNTTVVVFDQPFTFPSLGRISVGSKFFFFEFFFGHLKPVTSGEAGTTILKPSKGLGRVLPSTFYISLL